MAFNPHNIAALFQKSENEGRRNLLEHEVYSLLSDAGLKSIPHHELVQEPDRIDPAFLDRFPGAKIVLKIVSPLISHKTDVGGVKVILKDLQKARQVVADMLESVPSRFLQWLNDKNFEIPPEMQELTWDKQIDAVRNSIHGVMVVEFVEPKATGTATEVIFGLRWSREFGPVLTAGIGGVETELMAASMYPGVASISVSALSATPESMLQLFKPTLPFRKLTGRTRGSLKAADEEMFLECFAAFRNLASEFGPGSRSGYLIRELEVNPFVITGNGLVPLDGLCSFDTDSSDQIQSPVYKIKQMLHPDSMAIIGVSSQKLNMGRIILRNVIKNGFNPSKLFVIKDGIESIDEVHCVPQIKDLPQIVDVLVLAVDASQVPEVISSAAQSGKVNSVIIIPGGLGEKSGTESIVRGMNDAIRNSRMRSDKGPIFVGGNCLGILSRPGNYDTLFVPEQKLPKNYDKRPDPVALISQSGARMITVMSQHSDLSPVFAISTGNQMDLGVSDFVDYMIDNEPDIKVLAVYVEGFRDLGGYRMIQSVRRLRTQKRDVVFYKAGRTTAGKSATSGHTASVAGDYSVCAQLLEQAGAIVCDNFTEFNEMIRLAVALKDKQVTGNRLAAISNAGYEAVGIADNIESDFGFSMASYSPITIQKLKNALETGRLQSLVDVRNPMDVTPMATDQAHEDVIRAQIEDEGVDCFVAATIPLTPAQQTLPPGIFGKEDISNPESYPNRLIRIFRSTPKPMIVVIDSGELYDPMVKMMSNAGLPVFRTADLALRIFGKYLAHRK